MRSEARLPGEIAKIRAQADREASKVKQQIRLFDLNQEKLYADARLQQSKEGSAEELKSKINLLKIQANIEIAQAQGNSAKILSIKAKEKREEFELVRAANRKIADDALAANVAATNSKISQLTIAGADATNQQLLEAKQELVEEQAQIERVAVVRSIDTAENKVIRIRAINSKELADKIELEKQKAAAEINASENLNNASSSLVSNRAQRVIQNTKLSFTERQKASDDYYNSEINKVNSQLSAEESRFQKGIISLSDYNAKKLDIQDKYEALTTAKAESAAELRSQKVLVIAEIANATLGTLFNSLSTSQAANYQAELAAVQDMEDRKIITKEAAAKRQKAIRRNQAAEEKKLALFEAGLNFSLALSKAIASAAFPKNLFAIAFATFQGLAQISAIASRPLPQLWKGTKKAKEGVYRTGELGQELMWHKDTGFNMLGRRGEEVNYIPEGARVFNHIETIDIMRNFTPMATIPKGFEGQMMGTVINNIDAKEIGREVRAAIKEMPRHDIRIDKTGIHVIAQEGINKTEFLNSYYSSRK